MGRLFGLFYNCWVVIFVGGGLGKGVGVGILVGEIDGFFYVFGVGEGGFVFVVVVGLVVCDEEDVEKGEEIVIDEFGGVFFGSVFKVVVEDSVVDDDGECE